MRALLAGLPCPGIRRESPANRLFVEAAKLIQAAEEEAGGARKLELLKRARHKLERIVDSHPSSGLAVKLISGQKIRVNSAVPGALTYSFINSIYK